MREASFLAQLVFSYELSMRTSLIARWNTRPRKFALALYFFALSCFLLLAWIALFGVAIDGNPYRHALAQRLTVQTGRQIYFDGPFNMQLSLRPSVVVRDVRISQSAGFEGGEFLHAGELQIKLDLWPLLLGHIKADQISAHDVTLDLRQHADGSNNWQFGQTTTKPASADTGSGFSARDTEGIDIRHVELRQIRVVLTGVNGKSHEFELDQLNASAPINQALQIKASGKVEGRLPYQLEVQGGMWRDLAAGKPGWPLAMQLDFAGGRLVVQGQLAEARSELHFGLGAPDLASFGKVLGIRLPDAGAAGLSGAFTLTPGVMALHDLSGTLGRSVLTGDLQLDTRKRRPKLSGELHLPALDLRPFLGQDSEDDPPTDLRALYLSLAHAKLNAHALNELDADVKLVVGQWLSLPGDIREASLRLSLEQGLLKLPIAATVEEVPLQGMMTLNAAKPVPELTLSFGARNSRAGGLAKFLTGLPGIQGKLGDLQMLISARGVEGEALMRSMVADLSLKGSQLSYGNGVGGKPVGFYIDQLHMGVSGKEPLTGKLKGSLLGKPLEAELSGESLDTSLNQGSSPIALNIRSGQTSARLAGTLNGVHQRIDLSFSLGAEKSGEVAAWLGLRADSSLPIALAGKLSGSPDHWAVSQMIFQLGDSSLYVEAEQTETDKHAHLNLSLELARVDVHQLDSLLPSAAAKPRKKLSLDIPILPTQLKLDDADIRLRVKDIRGTQLSLGEMGFDGRIRHGFMQSSPFFASIAGSRYDGAVMLDARGSEPRLQLWLSAATVDLGKVARQLKLARHIEAGVDHLAFYLDSHSSHLSGLMANAQLNAEVSGGKLILQDDNTGSEIKLALARGVLAAAPGERLQLNLSGSMETVPVELSLRSATAKDLVDPLRRLPFELTLDAAKTHLQLSGTVDRDIEARDLELSLLLRGERFDALDPLLHVAMPPWGPWSATGRFRMNARGYAVEAMKLQVGSSSLTGGGSLDTRRGLSRLDINLSAPLIQLDDFRLAAWSATEGKRPTKASDSDADKSEDQQALRKKLAAGSDQVQGLLSPEMLRQLDASLSVRVEQVLSGKDRLGQGQLQARVANGRAEIGPVRLDMSGGSATGSLNYEPRAKEVMTELKMDVDNFDYGVLARRIKPESDLDGRFSLHVNVASRAPRLSTMLEHGNGKIDFAVWPKNLHAGVFDLWAVNVLVALLPTIDPKNESNVNCAIGRFSMADGKLSQKQLVIDTSRMRVTGATSIDFKDESLHMRLQPQAKTAQFLSLATPVEVSGSFSDFSVGPNPGDIIATAVRLATSILWVPLKKLFSDKVPADGSDVCLLSLQ